MLTSLVCASLDAEFKHSAPTLHLGSHAHTPRNFLVAGAHAPSISLPNPHDCANTASQTVAYFGLLRYTIHSTSVSAIAAKVLYDEEHYPASCVCIVLGCAMYLYANYAGFYVQGLRPLIPIDQCITSLHEHRGFRMQHQTSTRRLAYF